MGLYALSNTVHIKKCNAEHNWQHQTFFLKPDAMWFAHYTMPGTPHIKFRILQSFEANTVYHKDENRIGTVSFPFPSSTTALERSKMSLP